MTSRLSALLDLAGAPRGRVALAAALGALTVLCGVGLMATAGYLISRAAERPAILSLTVAIVGVRFFGLARPVVRYLERLTSHDLAFRVLGRTRARMYERIEPLAPVQLSDYRQGDLLSRLVADVDALQNLHLRGLGPPLVALVAGAVSVGVAASFDREAGAVLAAGLVLAGVVVPMLSAALGRRVDERTAARRGELAADLVELLRGAPELVVYGREDDRLARLRAADRSLVGLARRAALADGLGEGLRLTVCGATVAGVLAVAVSDHAAGSLDRVLIALLALLTIASFEAVQPLPEAVRELSETVAAGRRVLELTDRRPAVVDPPEPAPFPAQPFAIQLEGIRARYRSADPPALDGFDLKLEPGRRVALVGPSGAGKTTVTNLLLRFLDPERGRVTIAGRDVREYRQEDVRRAVSVAAQDVHLFSASIRDNVRLARPDADDRELERTLRVAGIWDWIGSLPQGLDTQVGEEGRELSGGQRQRLGVARTLLADAQVLVLDEPTAHLDPTAAERLIENVLTATEGRSMLLVTHRPEGLERMDEVVHL